MIVVVVVVIAAIVGLAVGRREKLKDDVVRAKDAGNGLVGKIKSRVHRDSDETEHTDDEVTDGPSTDDEAEAEVGDDSAD
jgi:hypothetical protein